MKRLLLSLLAAVTLPTAVDAETRTLTKNEIFDHLTYGSFSGSMNTICYADKKGFLSNNEKLDLIDASTYSLKGMLKNKTNYNRYKSQIFSGVIKIFPNCLD